MLRDTKSFEAVISSTAAQFLVAQTFGTEIALAALFRIAVPR